MPQTVKTNASLLERRERAIPRGPFHVAPIFAVRAEGSRLWDADGKEYLDFCGGIGVLIGLYLIIQWPGLVTGLID